MTFHFIFGCFTLAQQSFQNLLQFQRSLGTELDGGRTPIDSSNACRLVKQ
jgi:hypothetical protein